MVFNAEKRRHLAELALQRKAASGPSDVDASALVDTPTVANSATSPSAPAPVDHRQKGIVEAIASED